MVAGQGRQHDDRDGRSDRFDREQSIVEVDGDVGFVEDDDRTHAARPGDREVPLEAAEVEVVIEPGDQERHVDVGGQDLLVDEVARRPPARIGRAADERGPPGEHGGDDGGLVRAGRGRIAGERHPVPDRRVVRGRERLKPEPAGHDRRTVRRPADTVGLSDDRGLPVDGDHAGRSRSRRREPVEGIGPPSVPTHRRRDVHRIASTAPASTRAAIRRAPDRLPVASRAAATRSMA